MKLARSTYPSRAVGLATILQILRGWILRKYVIDREENKLLKHNISKFLVRKAIDAP